MKTHPVWLLTIASLAGVPLLATPPIGVMTQPLRSPLPARVTGFKADPHFILIIGRPWEANNRCSDSDNVEQAKCEGYDLFETINTFAVAVLGKPRFRLALCKSFRERSGLKRLRIQAA
jgi:hypothetical protein